MPSVRRSIRIEPPFGAYVTVKSDETVDNRDRRHTEEWHGEGGVRRQKSVALPADGHSGSGAQMRSQRNGESSGSGQRSRL